MEIDLVAVIGAIGALFIAIGTSVGLLATARKTLTEARVLHKQSENVSRGVATAAAELTHNHGSSVKDQVTRLEGGLGRMEKSIADLVGVVGETRMSLGGLRDDLRQDRESLTGHISDSRETHGAIHRRLDRIEAAFPPSVPTGPTAPTPSTVFVPPPTRRT